MRLIFVMIFRTKPNDFKSRFDIVSCFCEANNKILLLHRQKSRPQGLTWGVPAGKLDNGEVISKAIQREIFEETGVKLSREEISYFDKVFVRYPNYDFVYHIFNTKFEKEPEVSIDTREHKNFKWVTLKEALKMDLIQDLDNCIKLFYKL